MRKLEQEIKGYDPDNGIYGDCYRTCMAMILDMERDEVPHFFDKAQYQDTSNDGCMRRAREWLQRRFGLSIFMLPWHGESSMDMIMATMKKYNGPGVSYMLTGESGKFDGIGHVVVCQGDEVFADPSGSGLRGPIKGYWFTEVLCVADGRKLLKDHTLAPPSLKGN